MKIDGEFATSCYEKAFVDVLACECEEDLEALEAAEALQ